MIDPFEPNTEREIKLSYSTDETGDLSMAIDTTGFEEDPALVAFFLGTTIKLLADPDFFKK